MASADLPVTARSAWFALTGADFGLLFSTSKFALTRAVGRKAAIEMQLTG